MIVVVTLTSAVIGVAGREPVYTSTADILLTPLAMDDQTYLGLQLLRDAGDPTRTAQTAAALIDSAGAAQATAAQIGPPLTRDRVQQDVKVQPKGESNIVSVTAQAADPDLAARLANTFVAQALQARRTVLREQVASLIVKLRRSTSPETRLRIAQLESLSDGDDPTVSSSQVAQPPDSPDGSRTWLVILLSGVAGFAIASGAALLVEHASRRTRDEGQFLEIFPLPVLARIPKLKRSRRPNHPGASVVLPPGTREAFQSLQVQLDEHKLDRDQARSRVTMVTSASADDGKTTCSIGLAVAFVDAGYRVLLIDFDVRKSDLARRLGLSDGPGLSALIGGEGLPQVKDLIVSPAQLPALQVLLVGVSPGEALIGAAFARRLPAILDEARMLADYVILDTPPLGEVSDALRLIAHADDVLVVGRPGRTRSEDLELTRQLIQRTNTNPRGLVIVGAGTRGGYGYGR